MIFIDSDVNMAVLSAWYTIIFLYNKKWPRKNENDEVYTR